VLPTPSKKVRSSVEYNGMELVVPILLKYDVNNFQELIEKIQHMRENMDMYSSVIVLNESSDFEKYVEDIQKKEKIINKSNYITKFKEIIKNRPDFESDNIKSIYISGKTNKHAKIAELNKNIKKKEAKSDIYVEFLDGKISGVSIKQSKEATKSNYSIQTIFGEILGKEYQTNLNNTKKKYLNDNGIFKFDKKDRPKMNNLFYPQTQNNLYWDKVREIFANKNTEISKKLVDLLYCSNVNYDIFEYDGNSFEKLNKSHDCLVNSNISFEEYKPYYLKLNGKERQAAKMFCRLIVDEKTYRVEIRFKGDIYNSSPQFQIHR